MHLDHSSDCEEDFIQRGLNHNGEISSGELGRSLIIDKNLVPIIRYPRLPYF